MTPDLLTIGLLSDKGHEEALFKAISIAQESIYPEIKGDIFLKFIKQKIKLFELKDKLLRVAQEQFLTLKHQVKSLKLMNKQLRIMTQQIDSLEEHNPVDPVLSEMKKTCSFLESTLKEHKFEAKLNQLNRNEEQNFSEQIAILSATLKDLQQFVKESEPSSSPSPTPWTPKEIAQKAIKEDILVQQDLRRELYRNLRQFLRNPDGFPSPRLSQKHRELLIEEGFELFELQEDLRKIGRDTDEDIILFKQKELQIQQLEDLVSDLLAKIPFPPAS